MLFRSRPVRLFEGIESPLKRFKAGEIDLCIIRETTLPQETQQLHAVNFQKGCYIGQEIVERIRAQGHVNKKLVRLVMEAPAVPAPGTKLTMDGKDAGEITSAVSSPNDGVVALAYVRVPHTEPGAVLDAGGIAARVV